MNQKMDFDRKILNTIILNARPGAGKSELIKFMRSLDLETRIKDYHVGRIHVIDDFPYLWRWFEEDDILENMGKERFFSDHEVYFKYDYLWDVLIHLINLEYTKFLRDFKDWHDYTVFIKFSRGVQHVDYQQAYPLLSEEIMKLASILYVNVSWEESLRKNRQRFNPDKPDSILEHGIPDKKLEFLYSGSDFDTFTSNDTDFINIKGRHISYSVFENEDDVTTQPKPEMQSRLKDCLDYLWERNNN